MLPRLRIAALHGAGRQPHPKLTQQRPAAARRVAVGPTSAAHIATLGAPFDNNPTKPSGFVGGVQRLQLEIEVRHGCSGGAGDLQATAPTQHGRPEVSNPCVRHAGRAGSAIQSPTTFCSLHRGLAFRRIALRDIRPLCGIPPMRAGPRVSAPSSLSPRHPWTAQSNISTVNLRVQQLHQSPAIPNGYHFGTLRAGTISTSEWQTRITSGRHLPAVCGGIFFTKQSTN